MLGGMVVAAPAAEAQSLPLEYDVTATIHIESLDIDNTVEGGTFVGDLDLATGALTADLDLPASETELDLVGLPLAKAGFATEPIGQTTGTVNLADLTVSTSTELDILLTYLRPTLLPFVNLVGRNCQTREPITIETDGAIDLAAGIEISGEFTIPKFENCGLVTPILNLLIPGDGNTFTAVLE
jgi:hypothetical protein